MQEPVIVSHPRPPARPAVARAHGEAGIAILTSLLVLAALTIVGALVVYFASSSGRTAERAASKSEAAALAESGLAEAMAILSNPSTNRANASLLAQRASAYATGSVIWSGNYDAANSVWTISSRGQVPNPAGGDTTTKSVTAKIWTSEVVYTTTRTNGDGTTDREIWVMNLDGSGARQVTNDAFENGDAFWSPDTGTFVYESEEDTDAAASAGQSNAGGPGTTNREIYAMRVDGTGKIRLTDQDGTPSWNGSSIDEDPQWGPNGKVVFDTRRNGYTNSTPTSDDPNGHYRNNLDVYIMDSDGSDQTNLTACVPDNPVTTGTNEANYWTNALAPTRCSSDEEPAYGPGAVCIQSRRATATLSASGNSDVYKIPVTVNPNGSVSTGAPVRLTSDTADEAECDWSQDGTKIAYMSWAGGDAEVWVMNADGSGKVQLTNNTVADEHPGWTADGRIVFNSNRTSGAVNISNADGGEEIFVMSADGSSVTQLTFQTGIAETRFPDIRSRFALYDYTG